MANAIAGRGAAVQARPPKPRGGMLRLKRPAAHIEGIASFLAVWTLRSRPALTAPSHPTSKSSPPS